MHPPFVCYQVAFCNDAVEHVHEQGFAAAHATVQIHTCSHCASIQLANKEVAHKEGQLEAFDLHFAAQVTRSDADHNRMCITVNDNGPGCPDQARHGTWPGFTFGSDRRLRRGSQYLLHLLLPGPCCY